MVRSAGIWALRFFFLSISGASAQSSASWTATERWVHTEITAGRVADLDVRCRAAVSPSARAAETRLPEIEQARLREPPPAEDGEDPRWREPCRILSAAFVLSLLREVNAARAFPPPGIWIAGARIVGALHANHHRVTVPVSISRSRFEERLELNFARFTSWLAFTGSAFTKGMEAEGLAVEALLNFSNISIQSGGLNLRRARVGDLLTLRGARVSGDIVLEGIQVARSVLLDGGAVIRGKLDLTLANVGDSVIAIKTVVTEGIEGNGARIRAWFEMERVCVERGGITLNDAEMHTLDLTHAGIGTGSQCSPDADLWGYPAHSDRAGNLSLINARLSGYVAAGALRLGGHLAAEGMNVGTFLNLGDVADIRGSVNLNSARIGGNMNLERSRFHQDVRARGIVVQGEIMGKHVTVGGGLQLAIAKVGGPVILDRATLVKGFDAYALDTRALLIRHALVMPLKGGEITQSNVAIGMIAARVGAIELDGTTVFGDAVFEQATVNGAFYARSMRIEGALQLAAARVAGELVILDPWITGGLAARGLDVGGLAQIASSGGTATVTGKIDLIGARLSVRPRSCLALAEPS